VDRVRLGIVGCGNICQLNAPGYLEHPRCEFVDGVLEGRQPAQDVLTAKKVLQVPLAIYEASRTRRPVAPESMT